MATKPHPWLANPIVEQILRHYKVSWIVRRAQIVEIDIERSKLNRGRLTVKIDPNHITYCGVTMLNGMALPRIVLNDFRDGSGLVAMDGMHRLFGAIDAGFSDVEAYVVSITDEMLLDHLPMLFNQVGHLDLPIEDRYLLARHMVKYHGQDMKAAAKDRGIPEDPFYTYMCHTDCLERLELLNIDQKKISRGLLKPLNSLLNENLFAAAGRILSTYRVDVTSGRRVMGELREAKSERIGREIIERWEADLRAAAPRRSATGMQHRIRDALLRRLNGILEMVQLHPSLRQLQCTDAADKEVLRVKLVEAVTKFEKLFGAPYPFTTGGQRESPGARPGGPRKGR